MIKRIVALIFVFQVSGFILLIFIRKLDLNLPLPDQIFYSAFLLGGIFFLISRKLNVFKSNVLLESGNSRIIRILSAVLITAIFLTLPLQTIANVDRSRSLYMFGWIKCAPKGTSVNALNEAIKNHFGAETEQAFIMRANEQDKRGLVAVSQNEFQLTKTGEFIFISAKYLAQLYNLEGWYKNDLWTNKKCL